MPALNARKKPTRVSRVELKKHRNAERSSANPSALGIANDARRMETARLETFLVTRLDLATAEWAPRVNFTANVFAEGTTERDAALLLIHQAHLMSARFVEHGERAKQIAAFLKQHIGREDLDVAAVPTRNVFLSIAAACAAGLTI